MRFPGKNYEKRRVTSFDVSFTRNLLVSQGAMRYGSSVKDISRYAGPYLQDVPAIKCSLSMEMTRNMLKEMALAIDEKRNEAWGIKIRDHSTSINWTFDECYLQSLSLNVRTGGVLVGNIDMLVVEDSVEYSWQGKSLYRGTRTDPPIENGWDKDEGLVPYYACSLKRDGDTLYSVIDFSFQFQQPVTPRYECSGSSSDRAKFPSRVTFGVPTCSCSFSRVPSTSGDVEFLSSSDTKMNTMDRINDRTLDLYVWNSRILRMTGAVLESVAPSFDGFQPNEYRYRIFGSVKK